VQDIHVIPAEFVKKQIKAGLEDVGADVVKLGEQIYLIVNGSTWTISSFPFNVSFWVELI